MSVIKISSFSCGTDKLLFRWHGDDYESAV